MSSRFTATVVTFAWLLLLTTMAWAEGANDKDVRSLIDAIFETEVDEEKYDEAAEKLEVAKVVCEGDACSAKVRAELFIAFGTVQALREEPGDAKEAFATALKEDPKAKLRDGYDEDEVADAWNAAKGGIKKAATQGCRGTFKKKSRKGRSWSSAEAYHCYKAAKSNEGQAEWEQCAEDARASVELEDRVGTRSILARCLEADERWLEAIEEYDALAREAPKVRQFTIGRRASGRALQLRRRLPALVVKVPDDVEDLVVKLDGTSLPLEVLESEIPVDPGEHTVVAQGTRDGLPLTFEEDIDLEPGRTLTLPVRLAPGPPKWATRNEMQCMLKAKTPEDFAKCIKNRSSTAGDLKFRLSAEVSGYHDDMDVDVVSPEVSFNVEHTSDGWNLGASFLVDVVSAASVDILATASPRWEEVRYVPAINGGYKIDIVSLNIGGSLSHEPDYIATSVGGGIAVDLNQRTVTPSLGYEYSHDINGRKKTPFDVFSTTIDRHALSAGLGLVLTKATFGSLSGVLVLEDGDASKPYRHIPMFDPLVAPLVPEGLTVDGVNFFRLPERPLEQLPSERTRFGVAASLAHRFADSTLRLSERVYTDSWGVKASTTDARWMYDIVKEFRVWPHFRFHVQGGAEFYEMAYSILETPEGRVLPAIRTGDRELGPMYAFTGGLGTHLDLGARRAYGLTFTGDVVYTRFLEHLFVKERIGLFGALGFDAEFE